MKSHLKPFAATVSFWTTACLFVLTTVTWAAPPPTINLQGSLANATGAVTGTHQFLIDIYPQEVGGNVLQEATGTLTLSGSGRYSLSLSPSAAFLAAAEAWYQLAIDTNDNGIDGGDVFPQRVQVHSVPFALLSKDSEQLGGLMPSQYATDAELAAGLAGKAPLVHDHGDQYWRVNGNVIAPSTPLFLGSLHDQPVELRVNNMPALRLIPPATTPNLVAGYFANSATGVRGGVIAGGGDPDLGINELLGDFASVGGGVGNRAGVRAVVAGGHMNTATGPFSFIGGGSLNRAYANNAAIGGGGSNQADFNYSTIAGGFFNLAAGARIQTGTIDIVRPPRPIFGDGPAFVGGGRSNTATGGGAVVAGGYSNKALGKFSAVAGGDLCEASGDYSFAIGHEAKAVHNAASCGPIRRMANTFP